MYLVIIHYDRPMDEVAAVRPEHRDYLQAHYRRGLMVCSGPQVAGHGGVLLARGGDRAAVEALCAEDPYRRRGVAHHEIIEFEAKSCAPGFEPFAAPFAGAA